MVLCFIYSLFLIDRFPSLVLGFTSPWKKINSVSPPLSALKTFGCAFYPYLRPYNNHMLQAISTDCVFLGYLPLSEGYLCLDPNTNKIHTTYYALFNENVFSFANKFDLTNPHIPFSNYIVDFEWFPSNSNNSCSSFAIASSHT